MPSRAYGRCRPVEPADKMEAVFVLDSHDNSHSHATAALADGIFISQSQESLLQTADKSSRNNWSAPNWSCWRATHSVCVCVVWVRVYCTACVCMCVCMGACACAFVCV